MRVKLTTLVCVSVAISLILTSSILGIPPKGNVGWYEPTTPLAGKPGWERYEVKFTLYVMDWREFNNMIEFYTGHKNENIIGFCVSNGYRAEVYVPTDKLGKIDYHTLGHEVAHVVDIYLMRVDGKTYRFDPDDDQYKKDEKER